MIIKRRYIFKLSLLFVSSLYSCGIQVPALLDRLGISNHYQQKIDFLKQNVVDVAKKYPYSTGLLATGLSVYGIYCLGDYINDWRNPLPVLRKGNWSENAKKFNRALGFLREQTSFREAMRHASHDQMRRIFDTYHHKFDFETSMCFFQHADATNCEFYFTQLNGRNSNFICPDNAIEWFMRREVRSKFACYGQIRFFLERLNSISEQVVAQILNPCLYGACAARDTNAISYLLGKGARVSFEQVEVENFLSNAYYVQGQEAFLFLIRQQAIPSDEKNILANRLLTVACERGYHILVEGLISEWLNNNIVLDINTIDHNGNTLLHSACLDRVSFEFGSQDRMLRIIRSLIEQGRVDVNRKNGQGKSVLLMAYDRKLFDVAEYLLSLQEVDIDTCDSEGNTILHRACREKKDIFVKSLLRHFNADPALQNKQGETPLHIVCKDNNIDLVECLIQQSNINVNALNNEGLTALHIACENENLQLVQIILAHYSIDIFLRDCRNRSPLGILRAKQESVHNLIEVSGLNAGALLPIIFSFKQAVIASMLINKMRISVWQNLTNEHSNTLVRLSEANVCPICQCDVEYPKTTLCCLGAKFCVGCIKTLLLQKNPKCPICREVLFKEMIIDIPSGEKNKLQEEALMEVGGASIGNVTTEQDGELLRELAVRLTFPINND